MDLLHEDCEGYIDSLEPENYGRCEKCGEEGLFRVVREKDDNAFAIFYETGSAAQLLFQSAATTLLLALTMVLTTLHTSEETARNSSLLFCEIDTNPLPVRYTNPNCS
ncbi:MAG: hypothetical protein M3416_00070 [Acidobacteriota bacterium]|nr:hypothetical protein [Acidobacteriota bacterium]